MDTADGSAAAGREPFDFAARVVLVTGGTRGIGQAIARAFLERGAEVAVCARHRPDDRHLPRVGDRQATYIEADVRHAGDARRLVDATVKRFGRLDVVVNNAGGSPSVPAASASARFAEAIVALNLLGPFYVAQAANHVMQGQVDGGCIVNIGSVSGTRPSPGTALYGAAKAGLLNLTASLAVEWAPKVRVNCVVAGLVATEAADEHYGGTEGIAVVSRTVPLGRMGTPDDVAAACLLLASPLAGYVSGASLLVHGGGERPAFLEALAAQHEGNSSA
jgi:NAD(P)-dependent dehydrogenase (short-subunit alcohol dehydrogenase family)